MRRSKQGNVLASAVSLALATAAANAAEQTQPAQQTESLEFIEVLAKRVNARERTELAEPVLTYSEEYFQRFEPLSVGEMMKRVGRLLKAFRRGSKRGRLNPQVMAKIREALDEALAKIEQAFTKD